MSWPIICGNKIYCPDAFSMNYMYGEIFINRCYDINIENPKVIIDCGANIGLSVIYFHDKYPKAKIIAYEPGSAFDYLKRNVGDIKGISIIKKALGKKDYNIEFYEEKGKKGSLLCSGYKERITSFKGKKVIKKEATQVRLSDEIINIKSIDLLKIDVEGMEEDILTNLHYENCMKKIKNIIIEVHHDIKSISRLVGVLNYLKGYNVWFSAKKDFDRNNQDILLYAKRKRGI